MPICERSLRWLSVGADRDLLAQVREAIHDFDADKQSMAEAEQFAAWLGALCHRVERAEQEAAQRREDYDNCCRGQESLRAETTRLLQRIAELEGKK